MVTKRVSGRDYVLTKSCSSSLTLSYSVFPNLPLVRFGPVAEFYPSELGKRMHSISGPCQSMNNPYS